VSLYSLEQAFKSFGGVGGLETSDTQISFIYLYYL